MFITYSPWTTNKCALQNSNLNISRQALESLSSYAINRGQMKRRGYTSSIAALASARGGQLILLI